MRALYRMRVIQSNDRRTCVPVKVTAADQAEAKAKALSLTRVHSPIVIVDSVEEVGE